MSYLCQIYGEICQITPIILNASQTEQEPSVPKTTEPVIYTSQFRFKKKEHEEQAWKGGTTFAHINPKSILQMKTAPSREIMIAVCLENYNIIR